MAYQTIILKRAHTDELKFEKLLSCKFRIFRHFVTILIGDL